MRSLFALIGLIFLIIFFVFTLVVKKDNLAQFDFDMTVRLQDHIPEKFDTFFSLFSLLGSFEVTSVILLTLILFFVRKLRGFIVFGTYFFGLLVEIIGKSILHHPGPPFMFLRYNIEFFFPSSYVQTDSSYPSGHSYRTTFLAALILYLILKSKKINKLIKAVLISLLGAAVLIMLVSRVSLGEHWTSDVLGGAILGIGFGALSGLFL